MWSVKTVCCLLVLLLCAGIDLRYKSIPTALIIMAAAGSAAGLLLVKGDWVLAAGGALIGAFCLIVSKLTRQGLGYGDSLLILILGVFIGIWQIIGVLLIAFLSSSVYSIFLLMIRKKGRKYSYPFVPFLVLGYLGVICL